MTSIRRNALTCLTAALILQQEVSGFTSSTHNPSLLQRLQIPNHNYYPSRLSAVSDTNNNNKDDETQKLLDKAAQLRAEIAQLENKSIEEVEQEARDKKRETEERRERQKSEKSSSTQYSHPSDDGRFLNVPNSIEEQIRQAARAVEDAYKDGKSRQTIRLLLLQEGQFVSNDDLNEWPGGAKQMYREAARPLTEGVLKDMRIAAGSGSTDKNMFIPPPTVFSQDIWDFDGSGIVTSQYKSGPQDDVQALVQPNTDVKYLKDIQQIDKVMGDRLFLLMNPFWSNVESWGFNILAPNAKKLAQTTIFDRQYEETYVLDRKSVRGERCVALKVYPYDWQLFAYKEDGYYETAIRLGSSKTEPTSVLFTELLNDRDEFKYSRNMRQMMK